MHHYEFIYRRNSLKEDFQYHDFVREIDRSISEQKADVRKLIANGFDKKILNLIDVSQYKFKDNLAVELEHEEDNLIIKSIKYYPNTLQ